MISIDVEKTFNKIHYPLMIETLSKVGIERTYLNLIKAIYDKTTEHHTQWEKTTGVSLKTKNKKTGMSVFTIFIQHSTGSPSHSNQTRRNKRHPNCKGKSKIVIICR